MKKKTNVILVLVIVVSLTFGGGLYARTDTDNNIFESLTIFAKTLYLIKSSYVEDVNTKDLIYGALKGMMNTLDPYSQFMDPDTYQELKTEAKGEFDGVGIVITIRDDILTVISPIEGTPAYKAGVKGRDHIVKIDGQPTKDITLMEAVKKIRGPEGTSVILTIEREGELLEFEVCRAKIKIESVPYAFCLDDGLGYIRITTFNQNTLSELAEALKRLEEEVMQGLVLDLRNNPGGLLDISAQVADEFLDKGELIVSTKERKRGRSVEYLAKRPLHKSLPLAVLVNGNSASAAEIVAGAIQDWGRGTIVGTHTFGKGSVQSLLSLNDGSGLRLTTARYFTPKGRSIAEVGIIPDQIVEPVETLKVVEKLASEGYFETFAIRYGKAHPKIDAKFEVTAKILSSFLEMVDTEGFKFESGEFQASEDFIKHKILVAIISQALGKKAACRATLSVDPQFQRAVEVVKEKLKG